MFEQVRIENISKITLLPIIFFGGPTQGSFKQPGIRRIVARKMDWHLRTVIPLTLWNWHVRPWENGHFTLASCQEWCSRLICWILLLNESQSSMVQHSASSESGLQERAQRLKPLCHLQPVGADPLSDFLWEICDMPWGFGFQSRSQNTQERVLHGRPPYECWCVDVNYSIYSNYNMFIYLFIPFPWFSWLMNDGVKIVVPCGTTCFVTGRTSCWCENRTALVASMV